MIYIQYSSDCDYPDMAESYFCKNKTTAKEMLNKALKRDESMEYLKPSQIQGILDAFDKWDIGKSLKIRNGAYIFLQDIELL